MPITPGSDILATHIMGNIEVTSGTTHSLVTVANQRVIVWAKGGTTAGLGAITLNYNGVQKDTVTVGINDPTNQRSGFSLMYTETPGAGTHNITVGGSVADVVIIVLKSGT
jgi:hypothetical protein